jgi:hypothetical protein
MATTVERRRPSLSNKPALGGRSGYEAGDARISITARGCTPSLTHRSHDLGARRLNCAISSWRVLDYDADV